MVSCWVFPCKRDHGEFVSSSAFRITSQKLVLISCSNNSWAFGGNIPIGILTIILSGTLIIFITSTTLMGGFIGGSSIFLSSLSMSLISSKTSKSFIEPPPFVCWSSSPGPGAGFPRTNTMPICPPPNCSVYSFIFIIVGSSCGAISVRFILACIEGINAIETIVINIANITIIFLCLIGTLPIFSIERIFAFFS